jgi:hypothetical protein
MCSLGKSDDLPIGTEQMLSTAYRLFLVLFFIGCLQILPAVSQDTRTSKPNLAWYQTQVATTAIGALIGGIIGICGGIISPLVLEWRRRNLARRSRLAALRAEIEAIKNSLERGLLIPETANVTGAGWMFPQTRISQDHLAIYRTSAQEIGLLPSDLAFRITNFYGSVITLENQIEGTKNIADQEWQAFFRRNSFERCMGLIVDATELANELCNRQ